MKCAAVSVIALIAIAKAVHFPASFPKCSLNDKNINECLRKSIQIILPQLTRPYQEIGLVPLDPLKVATMMIPTGQGAVNFQQNYENVEFHGFSQLNLEKIDFNFENRTFFLEGVFPPDMRMTATYNFDGRILLLPLKGRGPAVVILDRTRATLAMKFKIVKKKGKDYLRVTTNKVTMAPKRVTFLFENLFGGDKILGDNINKVMNDNWKEVFEDVREGYSAAFGQLLMEVANGLFSKVPISEAFNV